MVFGGMSDKFFFSYFVMNMFGGQNLMMFGVMGGMNLFFLGLMFGMDMGLF